MSEPTKRYLTRKEAAAYLSSQGLLTSPGTLQKLAVTGGGPEYAIFGNRALYRPEGLIAWAEARLEHSRRGDMVLTRHGSMEWGD